MAEEVLLFGVWKSPYSCRVKVALKLKGVPYKYLEENLASKSPSLLKYNPVHKKIPVLVHNGKAIAESLVILEYIDETWQGHPLLPKDPYERAIARFWLKFMDEKCLPAIRNACTCPATEREKAVEEASEFLKVLENELNQNRFRGETIGMVDIVANITSFWLGAFEEVLGMKLLTAETFPKLYNWRDEFLSFSAIKESLPSREELVALYQKSFGSANASK